MADATGEDRWVHELLATTRRVLRSHGYRPLAESFDAPELVVDRVRMALRLQALLFEEPAG